jgi:hypothetical protein
MNMNRFDARAGVSKNPIYETVCEREYRKKNNLGRALRLRRISTEQS